MMDTRQAAKCGGNGVAGRQDESIITMGAQARYSAAWPCNESVPGMAPGQEPTAHKQRPHQNGQNGGATPVIKRARCRLPPARAREYLLRYRCQGNANTMVSPDCWLAKVDSAANNSSSLRVSSQAPSR